MITKHSGKTRIKYYPKKASVAFKYGDAVYLDSNDQIAPHAGDGSSILGVALKAIRSTDTDYTQNTLIPIEVPVEENVEWDFDTTGLVSGDFGRYIGISSSDAGVVDRATTADGLIFVTKVISSTKGIGVFQSLVDTSSPAVGGVFVTVSVDGTGDYNCDNVADQVEINAAMTAVNAAGGGTVFLKAGIYYISDVLRIPSNVRFVGAGKDITTVKAIDNYDPATNDPDGNTDGRVMLIAHTAPVSNIEISNITFDANVQNISGLSSNTHHRAIWIQGSASNRSSNIRFVNNKVLNTINWAVFFQYVNNLWIMENTVLGGYSSTYDQNDGLHVRNSSRVFICDNYVDTNFGGGTSGDDAIAFLSNAGSSGDSTDILIKGNILSSGTSGIDVGVVLTNHLQRVNICNNVIWHTEAAGIACVKFADNVAGRLKDIVINANIIYDYSNVGGGAIRVVDRPSVPSDETVFENVTITHNIIKNNIDTLNTRAIDIGSKGTGLVISGNQIRDFNGNIAAIMVGETSHPIKDFVISNNSIDCSAGADISAIRIYGGERGVISGNEIYGTADGTSYGISIYASNTAGNDNDGVPNIETSAYINVQGNQIYNVDNGIAEINDGANPNNNRFVNNQFNTVTTPYTIVGTNSVVLDYYSNSFISLNNGNSPTSGIGHSSPISTLELNSTRNFLADISSPTHSSLLLRNNDTTNGEAVGMSFAVSTGNTAAGAAIYHTRLGTNSYGHLSLATRPSGGSVTERLRITDVGNLKVGGSADRGTTEGTNQIVLFNGTAPAGTLSNGASFYADSGEMRVMDAAGNSTLLSPHDHETNEWIFFSKNTNTGQVLRIDMERMMRALNDKLGGGFISEYVE